MEKYIKFSELNEVVITISSHSVHRDGERLLGLNPEGISFYIEELIKPIEGFLNKNFDKLKDKDYVLSYFKENIAFVIRIQNNCFGKKEFVVKTVVGIERGRERSEKELNNMIICCEICECDKEKHRFTSDNLAKRFCGQYGFDFIEDGTIEFNRFVKNQNSYGYQYQLVKQIA